MLSYILRRLVATVPVMLIVAVLVFLMLRLTPGDPAAIIAGDNANTEQVVYVPFGQWTAPIAYRADRISGIVPVTGLPVFWNIEKK